MGLRMSGMSSRHPPCDPLVPIGTMHCGSNPAMPLCLPRCDTLSCVYRRSDNIVTQLSALQRNRSPACGAHRCIATKSRQPVVHFDAPTVSPRRTGHCLCNPLDHLDGYPEPPFRRPPKMGVPDPPPGPAPGPAPARGARPGRPGPGRPPGAPPGRPRGAPGGLPGGPAGTPILGRFWPK